MRIVAGRLRGRPLKGPADDRIRPTSDRLRESLFNILVHRFADRIEGARVLDLFAGTGALGIEALSRGASAAVFVDDAAEARGLIRENIEALGLAAVAKVFRRDATALGPVAALQPFDLVFCDPPYRKGLAEKALASARSGGWLAADALVVVEESADAILSPPPGFQLVDEREAGSARLHLLTVGAGA